MRPILRGLRVCAQVGIIDIGSGRDRGKRSLHHVADRGRIFRAEGREETLPWIHVVRYVCPYPIEIRLIQKHSRMDEGGRRTGACVGRSSPRPLRLHGACRRFRPALRVTRGSLGGRRVCWALAHRAPRFKESWEKRILVTTPNEQPRLYELQEATGRSHPFDETRTSVVRASA